MAGRRTVEAEQDAMEEAETARPSRRRLALLAIAPPLVASLVAFGVYLHLDGRIQARYDQNRFLMSEIQELDERIAEIRQLQQQRRALLDRMEVIRAIQFQQNSTVRLLDELRQAPPTGVLLTRMEADGNLLQLTGIADSVLSVSEFIGALDASPWLRAPVLQGMARAPAWGESATDFSVQAELWEPESE